MLEIKLSYSLTTKFQSPLSRSSSIYRKFDPCRSSARFGIYYELLKKLLEEFSRSAGIKK